MGAASMRLLANLADAKTDGEAHGELQLAWNMYTSVLQTDPSKSNRPKRCTRRQLENRIYRLSWFTGIGEDPGRDSDEDDNAGGGCPR